MDLGCCNDIPQIRMTIENWAISLGIMLEKNGWGFESEVAGSTCFSDITHLMTS